MSTAHLYVLTPTRPGRGLTVPYPNGQTALVPCMVGGPGHKDTVLAWAPGHEDRALVHCRTCAWTETAPYGLADADALAAVAAAHRAHPADAHRLEVLPEAVRARAVPAGVEVAPAPLVLYLEGVRSLEVVEAATGRRGPLACGVCSGQGLGLLWAAGHGRVLAQCLACAHQWMPPALSGADAESRLYRLMPRATPMSAQDAAGLSADLVANLCTPAPAPAARQEGRT